MTNKSAFALAAILASALSLGSLSLATDASAREGGGYGGGGHPAAGHFAGHPGAHFAPGHGPGARFVPGPRGQVFVGGHRRHFWHGRWWGYGIGPCWQWSNVYGEYVWVCD